LVYIPLWFKDAMPQRRKSEKTTPFSKPWLMSDAVLLVESETFHVHRSILASCSQVFESIFSTNNADAISLPSMTTDDAREMLFAIYPHVRKDISDENCVRLIELAHEYKIQSLLERCENYLKNRKNSAEEALHLILLSQLFNLSEDFIQSCMEVAKRIPPCSLEASDVFGKLDPLLARELLKESVDYWEKRTAQAHIFNASMQKAILYLQAKELLREHRKQRLSQLRFELIQKRAFKSQKRVY